ncbi:MAG: polysaccharide deacetylase family protein [Eubacterium sp.]|nr:polysaccharide deacetylase family protein [Eubacterium sp.]
MTGDTLGKVSADYRKKRVKRIKRIIIFFVLVLLLAPTGLCIWLLMRMNALETKLDSFNTQTTVAVSQQAVDAAPDTDAASGTAATAEPTPSADPDKPGKGKKVYLTFDDGPGPNTEKLLDTLKKYDVKATFFVTGKEDDFSKKMYKRIVDEGHTLGMHSYSHVYDEIYASEMAFSQDLDKLYEYLHDVTGVYAKYYRFPGGSSVKDTKVPIEKLIEILEKKDITYLDWNVLSPDIRDTGVGKKEMRNEILADVEKYDTSVVVFYDTQTQPMTVKTLSSVIRHLKESGYEILPVDENTAPIRHNQ